MRVNEMNPNNNGGRNAQASVGWIEKEKPIVVGNMIFVGFRRCAPQPNLHNFTFSFIYCSNPQSDSEHHRTGQRRRLGQFYETIQAMEDKQAGGL
jgi:hypothetical protein